MAKGEGIYPAPTHKSMKELDAGLSGIQKSTRASIPAMVPAHDILRQKFSWYYDWHLNAYASKLHSIVFILYFLVVGFIATSLIAGGKLHTAKAATGTCNWIGASDTSWSNPDNWDCPNAGIPTINDDVFVNAGSNNSDWGWLDLDTNTTVASFTITPDYMGTVNLLDGFSLTTEKNNTTGATGNFTYSGSNAAQLVFANNNITVGGNLTFTNPQNIGGFGSTFIVKGSTIDVPADKSIIFNNLTIDNNGNEVTVTQGQLFTDPTGTISLANNAVINIPESATNTFSAGTFTMADGSSIVGGSESYLNIAAASADSVLRNITGNVYLSLQNNNDVSSESPPSFTAYNGINVGQIDIYNANLVMGGSSNTLTTGGIAVIWDLVPSSLTVGANKLISGDLNSSGMVSIGAGGEIDVNSGNWYNEGTLTADVNSTVIFNGTATDVVQQITEGGVFGNVIINNSGSGSSSVQLSSGINIDGNFRLQSGTFDTNTKNQNFAKDFRLDNNTTYTTGGTLTFDGTTIYTDNGATAHNIGDWILNGTSLTLATSMKTGKPTITAGTFDLGDSGYTLDLTKANSADLISVSGTFDPGTSTVKYTGVNASSTVNVATIPYNNLEIAGAETYVLTGNLTATNAIANNLKIDSDVTLDVTASNFNIALAGNYENAGTLTYRSNTISFTKASPDTQTLKSGGVGAGKIFNNLVHSGTGTLQLSTDNINIDGNFTNSAGVFDTNNLDMTIAGNTNLTTGSFTQGTRTITLDGLGAQSFTAGGTGEGHTPYNLTVANTSGNTLGVTFTDSLTLASGGRFTATTAGSKLTFTSGASYNFSLITINGSGAGDVTMTGAGTWNFIVPGTPTVTYVAVDHSNATGSGAPIDATSNCHDNNGNTNWNFVSANTISGALLDGISGSPITDVKTIKASVNGVLSVEPVSTVAGNYTITLGGTLSANQIVTVFVSGDPSVKASTVTKVNGAGNLTGINLYQSYTTLQQETGISQLNNDDLNTAWILGDTDMLFSVIDGTKATFDYGVYIPADEKYTPGGDATVLGNWVGTGSFDGGSYQVVFSADSGTQILDTGGTGANHIFKNLDHDDASTLKLSNDHDLEVDGNFTQRAGEFDANSKNQFYGGNVSITENATYTKGGTLTFDGTGNYTDSNSTPQNIGVVIIDGSTTLASNMTVDILTINNTKTLDLASSGYTFKLANIGATATVLTVNGTLATGTNSTVDYVATNSGSGVTVANITYNNIKFSGGDTYNLTGNFIVNGNFENASGTFKGTGTTTLLGNNKTISGAGTNNFTNLTIQGSRNTLVDLKATENMLVDTNATLTTTADLETGTINLQSDVFNMNTGSTLAGNSYYLNIYASNTTTNSTLQTITGDSYFVLDTKTEGYIPPTFVAYADIHTSIFEIRNANLTIDGSGHTITGTLAVIGDINPATVDIGQNKVIGGDIAISSFCSLTLGSGGEIDVSSSWSNSGTFTAKDSLNTTVIFNGSSNQYVLSNNTNFPNLLLKSTGFIQFNDPFTVSGNFVVDPGSKLQFAPRIFSFPNINFLPGNPITLQGIGSDQWTYNTSAMTLNNNLKVRDSSATSLVQCATCTDLGNNKNWKFVPPAPVAVSSEALPTTTTAIRWHFNASKYADGYILDNASGSVSCSTADSYCDETGLSANTEYSGRRVKAYNNLGTSPQSNEFPSATTNAESEIPIIKPNPPTNLRSVLVTATSIDLAWDAPKDMTSVTSYQLFNNEKGIKIGEATKTITTLSNLQPNTAYQFIVKSVAGYGNLSDASNILSVTTLVSDTDILAKSAYLVLGNVPGDTTAGQSFSDSVNLTVADAGGSVVPTYTGTIYFSSSDKDAVFNYNQATPYVFTVLDKGIHEFAGRDFVFNTAGQQVLGVTDGTIESKVNIKVKPGNNVLSQTQAAFTSFLKGDTPVVDNSVVGTTTALLLAPATINLILGLGNLIPQLLFWLLQAMQALGIRKKRAPWGVVFNSQTGQPVSLALVRVYDKEYKRLLETAVTDSAGRFGFLIGKGNFYITVTKTGFTFPSQYKLSGFFSDIYTGGTINSTNKDTRTIDLNIPLDPQTKASLSFNLSTYLVKFSGFVDNIRLPLLLIGALFAIVISLRTNNMWFFLLLGFYLVIFILELKKGKKARPYGLVTDIFEHPLETAIVRIYHKKTNRLMSTDVTDKEGRFKFLVDPGVYYIIATKPGYLDYKSHIMYLEKERTLVTTNIKLRKMTK